MRKAKSLFTRKWFILCLITVFALGAVYGVSSYTSTNIQSQTMMRITDTSNASIAITDNQVIEVTAGGTAEDSFSFINHMLSSIENAGIGIDAPLGLTIARDNAKITSLHLFPLSGGSAGEIPLKINATGYSVDNIPTGEDSITIPKNAVFTASWNGGSAEINTHVIIKIYRPIEGGSAGSSGAKPKSDTIEIIPIEKEPDTRPDVPTTP